MHLPPPPIPKQQKSDNTIISFSAGFTLVELMVVVAIIGIFTAVLFVSGSIYFQRSRDTVRVIDVREIAKTLMGYQIDHTIYPPADFGGCVPEASILIPGGYTNKLRLSPGGETYNEGCGENGRYAYGVSLGSYASIPSGSPSSFLSSSTYLIMSTLEGEGRGNYSGSTIGMTGVLSPWGYYTAVSRMSPSTGRIFLFTDGSEDAHDESGVLVSGDMITPPSPPPPPPKPECGSAHHDFFASKSDIILENNFCSKGQIGMSGVPETDVMESSGRFYWMCVDFFGGQAPENCEADKGYRVVFNSMGGTSDIFPDKTIDVMTGKKNVLLVKNNASFKLSEADPSVLPKYQMPTLSGYTFDGWYTDPASYGSTGYGTNGNVPPPRETLGSFDPVNPPLYGGTGTKIQIDGAGFPITANTEYYAGWRPESGVLELVYVDGSLANFYLTALGNVRILSSNGSVIKSYNNPVNQEVQINFDPGKSTITILGDVKHFYPKTQYYNNTLLEIKRWDNIKWSSMNRMFQDTGTVNTKLPETPPNLSEVKDMSYMFYKNTAFNRDISRWDVSHVENMSHMFENSAFNQPLDKWNVSSVTNMEAMFKRSPYNAPLNGWGDTTRNVQNMQAMFYESRFNQPIDQWDVSSVTDMSEMFAFSYSFNQPLNGWGGTTQNVQNMANMFFGAQAFNQPIQDWNVSSVLNMQYMFAGRRWPNNGYIPNPFNQPLDKWNVSNVTDMSHMFEDSIYNASLNGWEDTTRNVKTMSHMFDDAYHFNQPLDKWNVSNVTDMSYMFHCDRGSYVYPKACNLQNQDLSNWNVSNVMNMEGMFSGVGGSNYSINNWNVSGVTNMKGMFASAGNFNEPIGNWNVSNVTNMEGMFTNTPSFDQPLDKWNVSSVTNMNHMFYAQYTNRIFSQDLSGWNVSGVTACVKFNGFYYSPIRNFSIPNFTSCNPN